MDLHVDDNIFLHRLHGVRGREVVRRPEKGTYSGEFIVGTTNNSEVIWSEQRSI